MKEQDSADKNIRSESQKAEVTKVLSYLSQSVTVSSVRRIGRYDSNKNSSRPVKVTLASPVEVHELLRKTPMLKGSEAFKRISIFADKTPRQMEYYKKLKRELEERIGNGETNIKIKYWNGTPKIVNF
nr:unnamed protein product [Callosobruchus analis]